MGLGIWGLGWYVALDNTSYYDSNGMIHDWWTDTNSPPFGFKLSAVTDGLSNTMMAVERVPSVDLYWGWWGWPTPYDTRAAARNQGWAFYYQSQTTPNYIFPVPPVVMHSVDKDWGSFHSP